MKSILAGAAWRITVCVLAFGSLFVGRELFAASVKVADVSALPGASVDVCVSMAAGGEPVAGVQANLHWDGRCTGVNMAGGTAAQCRANTATGKNVQTSVAQRPCRNDPNCLTALLLSVSDSSPIPDGELFCCSFSVLNAPSSTRCDINITDVILSGPAGKRVGTQVQNGTISVVSSGGGAPAAVGRGPAVSAPVVSGGGGPAAGGGVPAAGGGAPAAPGGAAPAARGGGVIPNVVPGIAPPPEQVPVPAGEAAPGIAPPPPTRAPEVEQVPTAVPTAQRTPAAATTPTRKAPTPQPTGTAAVKAPTPAPTAHATAGATPAAHKRHKKKPKPTPE